MDTGRLVAALSAYGLPLRAALELGAEQGFRRVELDALASELDPSAFGESARRHLRKILYDLGLEPAGLSVRFPGVGLADPDTAEQRVDRLRAALELAQRLGAASTVVTLSGFDDARHGRLAEETLRVAADLADRIGAPLCVLDPQSPLQQSAQRVRACRCPALHVAMDTAWHSGPGGAAEHVGAAYLRDVRRAGQRFEEVDFGSGEVDFRSVLAGLEGAGGGATMILRPEAGGRVDALARGREYIASLSPR